MADVSQRPPVLQTWKSIDKVWLVVLLIPALVAVFDPPQLWPTLTFAAGAFARTSVFIAVAVTMVGFLKATGSETLLAKAFEGPQLRMIVLAALLGGLSPFCSCQVIPFIAALLAVGAPLSAVMAFWLSSPLMDPAMFTITAAELGADFAIAKTVAAVGLGILGGLGTMAFAKSAVFANPLKEQPAKGGCGCGPSQPFSGRPVWRFWTEQKRIETFRDAVVENALFLSKWLIIAYLLESLMIAYVPAELIANILGGGGTGTIALGALVGMPAYLNGYAAVGLMDALLAQGMADGAAMAFVIAGGVSSVPAAIAVWALVKPRVFGAYLGFAFTGALIAGLAWNAVA